MNNWKNKNVQKFMFDTEMKDDEEIAAPSLAPSPPAQCWPTLRAARCRRRRVTQFASSSPPLLFPLTFSLGEEEKC